MPTEPDPQSTFWNIQRPDRRRDSYAQMLAMEPHSRDSDPIGSFEAAEQVRKTGLGGRQRLAVYHALRAHQGSTSKELAQFMGCDRYTPARRLVELETAGWVCRGARRKCRVSGIESVTWFISRSWIENPKPRTTNPQRDLSRRAGTSPVVNVTTPEEHRALREKLTTTGDQRTRRFLAGVSLEEH